MPIRVSVAYVICVNIGWVNGTGKIIGVLLWIVHCSTNCRWEQFHPEMNTSASTQVKSLLYVIYAEKEWMTRILIQYHWFQDVMPDNLCNGTAKLFLQSFWLYFQGTKSSTFQKTEIKSKVLSFLKDWGAIFAFHFPPSHGIDNYYICDLYMKLMDSNKNAID